MSISGTQPTAPGWYPDPAGSGGQRWHDGQGWTGQVMQGKPVKGLGKGFAVLADWLGRGLLVCAVLYGLMALVFAYFWLNPPDVPTPQLSTPTATSVPVQGEATGAGSTGVLLLDLAFTVVALLTQVTWLVWQYQLAAAAPARLRRSPGMHVVAWFLPLANLVMPRSNIGDLWRAYGTQERPGSEPTPAVFSAWWGLWLSPILVLPVFVLVLLRASTPSAAVAAFFGTVTLMFVGQACAGFAARVVVRELSWRALVFWSEAA